jgi:hypothetical protein
MNPFDQLVSLSERTDEQLPTLNKDEYQKFLDEDLVVYALQGMTFGEAFCHHFNLGRLFPLYHSLGSPDFIKEIIIVFFPELE